MTAMETSRMGRRPKRSDSEPISGGEAELHDRVGRRQDPAPERRVGDRDAAHLGDEVRHDRQDQPDAHGVERDGDHDEDDRQPHGTPGRCQATVNLD
jgi:hypothetical protein